jgi:hypothetical protein
VGIFDSRSESSRDNRGQESSQDGQSGIVNYGDGNVRLTSTDHGAMAAGVGLAQSGLAVSNNAVLAALQTAGAVASDSLNFGAKSLDFASYNNGLAFDFAGQSQSEANNLAGVALDTVNNSTAGLVDKLNGVMTTVLSNGQQATTQALSYAKQFSQSESKNSSDLMIKAVAAIAIVAVIGFVIRGKK